MFIYLCIDSDIRIVHALLPHQTPHALQIAQHNNEFDGETM